MAQKVTGFIKLQIPAGKATPAPPVGPALGQHGVNIMAFTKEFNERTKNDAGLIIPVVITVYADRSFSFITKTPPAAVLIKKACGIETASGVPNKNKVAQITKAQVQHPQSIPDITLIIPILFPIRLIMTIRNIGSIFRKKCLNISTMSLTTEILRTVRNLPIWL